MIYEIFNAVDGSTQGYRWGEDAVKKFFDALGAPAYSDKSGKLFVLDYSLVAAGFYVLDMRNRVKAGPFATKADATKKSDFENMASDTNSFHVYEQVN